MFVKNYKETKNVFDECEGGLKRVHRKPFSVKSEAVKVERLSNKKNAGNVLRAF